MTLATVLPPASHVAQEAAYDYMKGLIAETTNTSLLLNHYLPRAVNAAKVGLDYLRSKGVELFKIVLRYPEVSICILAVVLVLIYIKCVARMNDHPFPKTDSAKKIFELVYTQIQFNFDHNPYDKDCFSSGDEILQRELIRQFTEYEYILLDSSNTKMCTASRSDLLVLVKEIVAQFPPGEEITAESYPNLINIFIKILNVTEMDKDTLIKHFPNAADFIRGCNPQII